LLVVWLSDKVINELFDEDMAIDALKLAETRIIGLRNKE